MTIKSSNQTVEFSLDSRPIECKLIDVPKTRLGERVFSKEFAIKLADSLKIDGQLQPIVVRPNPASPGRYILVAGKHRLYGLKNVLKEQFIRAVVLDMDEAEADMATTVENLWRNPLSKAEHSLHMKRWLAHWLSKNPSAGGEAKPEDKTEPTGTKTEEIPQAERLSTEAIGDQPEKTETDPKTRSRGQFDETVAAATGQSVQSVRRTKRLAEAFTPEQLEVFQQMEVNQTDMTTIAKIKDELKRGEVVSLVASGMEVDDAIKEVMKDAAPVRDNGKPKAEAQAKEEAKAEAAPELSDDEWFDKYCCEKAAMFNDPARFKADALLYRALSDMRHMFRSKAKKSVAATRKNGIYGGFTNLVYRFISISHPKDWLICPECKGAGTRASQSSSQGVEKCHRCFGSCYLLKTEEYL